LDALPHVLPDMCLCVQISEANERAVCESIIDGCTEALNGYITSIDEDIALLRDNGLTIRQRIAVQASFCSRKANNPTSTHEPTLPQSC